MTQKMASRGRQSKNKRQRQMVAMVEGQCKKHVEEEIKKVKTTAKEGALGCTITGAAVAGPTNRWMFQTRRS